MKTKNQKSEVRKKYTCPRCLGKRKTKHRQTDELINCYKCQGTGHIYSAISPKEQQQQKLQQVFDVYVTKKLKSIENELKILKEKQKLNQEIQEMRNKQILLFFEKILRLNNHAKKNSVKVRMKKFMEWVEALVDEKQWKRLEELEYEPQEKEVTTSETDLAKTVDFLEEILNKREVS